MRDPQPRTDPMATTLFELFPTPVLHVTAALPRDHVRPLRERFSREAALVNSRNALLSHTEILNPADDPALRELALSVGPHVIAFGRQLFGESLRWAIKEMWVNVLQTGGYQSAHTHANSFISGIVYLTDADASSRTAFIRALGGHDFIFRNTNAQSLTGSFNADRWIAPEPSPGDLLLFPSYLLHEVPANRGGERITLSFNAIPHRLDAWGYAIEFSA